MADSRLTEIYKYRILHFIQAGKISLIGYG